MKLNRRSLTTGYLLIIAGLLLILKNLDLFEFNDKFLWGMAFVTIGVAFLATYQRSTRKIGMLIGGFIFTLSGLSLIIHAIYIFPDELIGTLILWCIASIFITIHFQRPNNWWAIIPGGIFFIFGVMVVLTGFKFLDDDRLWFVFFLGLSLIFWYLFLIKNKQNRLGWAQYPAIILSLFSFLILSITWDNQLTAILLPISIIIVGIYLIIHSFSKKVDSSINEE